MLALLIRLPFMFDHHPVVAGDSIGYLFMADNVVHGHGFGDFGLFRPPVYPLFIVLVKLLPGPTVDGIVIIQHLLGAVLAAAVVLVAWRFFGRPAAIIAGLLAAISPQLIAVEHQILSDWLFVAFVFASVTVLAFAAESGSTRLLMLTGVLFGVATLVKPLGQVLIFIAPVVLLFAFWRHWKAILRGSVVVSLCMVVVIVPWVVRNQLYSGHAVVSSISNQVLFWRVFDAQPPLPFVGDDPDTRMVRKLYVDERAGGPDATVWVSYAALVKEGYTTWEASARMKDMATRAIRANPGKYASQTFEFFRFVMVTAGPRGSSDTIDEIKPTYTKSINSTPNVLSSTVAGISWPAMSVAPWLTAAWWICSGLGLAGLFVLRSRDRTRRIGMLTFVAAWAIVGLGTALTGLPELRYNVVDAPFLWIMGSAGIVAVAGAISRWATAGDASPSRQGAPDVA